MVRTCGSVQCYVKDKYLLEIKDKETGEIITSKKYNRLLDIVADVPFSYGTLKNINRGMDYKNKWSNYVITKLEPTRLKRIRNKKTL